MFDLQMKLLIELVYRLINCLIGVSLSDELNKVKRWVIATVVDFSLNLCDVVTVLKLLIVRVSFLQVAFLALRKWG